MKVEAVPIWALFVGTMTIVVLSIECGYRLGRVSRRKSRNEKESSVSNIAGAVLGLLAFMLAFTFGIVADRYDSKRALVREEAGVIRTAYLRSDFLPEHDRSEAALLFKDYVDTRLAAARSLDFDRLNQVMTESHRIHRRLWSMAVANARKDMNSDVAALYIDSLNQMINIHSMRVAVAVKSRIPGGIWLVLCALIILGMSAVGYHAAIADSGRSWVLLTLILSFSLVVALIASLDNPTNRFISVPQHPLMDLRASM